MPGIIDSAPDCVVSNEAAEPPDDSADFILQANYEDCAGFMTFGPGSTYGDEGAAADTLYYILTWLGIVATVVALIAWVIYENRQLISHVARYRAGIPRGGERVRHPWESEEPPPQPGAQS
jgi:hypothetical protein